MQYTTHELGRVGVCLDAEHWAETPNQSLDGLPFALQLWPKRGASFSFTCEHVAAFRGADAAGYLKRHFVSLV